MLVQAQQQILIAWLVIIAAAVGWGGGLRRLCGWPMLRAADLWLSFWIGWCAIIAFLQIWHIFALTEESYSVGNSALS